MLSEQIIIVNRLGLHARAAALFVKTARTFDSDIRLGCDGSPVNGKDIMSLLMLAAGKGARLTLSADGSDEAEAIDTLTTLVANRFNEDE